MFVFSTTVLAIPKTPSDSIIEERCKQAQTYLQNTLRLNDLRGRVNRLQVYEYLYLQFEALSTRLENNNQPQAASFKKQTEAYRETVDSFIKNYENYDHDRDELAQLKDCQKNPVAFKKALVQMRVKRELVAKDIAKLQEHLTSEFPSQLTTLQESLLSLQSPEEQKND